MKWPASMITFTSLTALALLAGCTEGPTAPTPAESLFAKAKECPGHPSCGDGGGDVGSQNYHITVTGDVTGDGATDHHTTGMVARGYQLDVSTFLSALPDAGFATCFDASAHLGLTLAVRQGPPMFVNYYFEGLTSDGKGVTYLFQLLGGQSEDTWPPEEGVTSTATFSGWSVAHDSGGSAKTACSGSGSLSATVEVTGLAASP